MRDAYLYVPQHHIKAQFSRMKTMIKELAEKYAFVFVFTDDARSFFWHLRKLDNVVALESTDNIISNIKLLTDSFNLDEGLDLYIYKSPHSNTGIAQATLLEHSHLLRDILHDVIYYDIEDKDALNIYKTRLAQAIYNNEARKNEKS